ncbi:Ribosomal RNA-processing protein 8 [Dirofilaria immitis]|nr:Ribosomal RNA-processing protein 8 [Dirofilaria immitis]
MGILESSGKFEVIYENFNLIRCVRHNELTRRCLKDVVDIPMSYKEKLENKDSIIPSRQEKVDYSEEVGTLVVKFPRKQHRPWRNKVRKKLLRKRKRRLRRRRRGKIDSSLFRYINEQLYTMNSAEAMKLFQKEPEAFELYHKGYQKQVRKWPYNPIHIIIQWIRSLKRDSLVIADLGCGNAMIAKTLSHIATVHSFDLVAANDRVTACDMSMRISLINASFKSESFLICFKGHSNSMRRKIAPYWFLKLMNVVNFKELDLCLFAEVFLKIAEVASRFINVKQFVHAVKNGFAVFGKMMKDGGYFYYLGVYQDW